MRLTPRQRAAVRVRLAQAIGEGRPVDRHVVIAELFGSPRPEVMRPVDYGITVTVDIGTDVRAVTPDAVPDEVVSVDDAARMLGVTALTVRAYCAPSRSKLVRVGDGVSLASVLELVSRKAA